MKIVQRVYHTHTDLEKNVECNLIETEEANVYRCPQCDTEIVVQQSVED